MAKKTTTTTTTTTTETADHGLCRCGCGEALKKGRTFRQGHDARFAGRVTKVKDGRMTWDEVRGLIQAYAVEIYEAQIGSQAKTTAKVKKTTKPTKKTETPEEANLRITADLVKTSNQCHEPLIPVTFSKPPRKIRVKKTAAKTEDTLTPAVTE